MYLFIVLVYNHISECGWVQCFPSITVNSSTPTQSLGHVTFAGRFLESSRGGTFPPGDDAYQLGVAPPVLRLAAELHTTLLRSWVCIDMHGR